MDNRSADPIQGEDREARVFQEVSRIPLRFDGPPIRVRFQPALTAHRGQLLTRAKRGQPVFAAAFLRQREIVLDDALVKDHQERARILVHELFHFVWLRLGNPRRASWSALLHAELACRARGELGWSAEWRKLADPTTRDYISESFCDTAAWLYAGLTDHKEFTLAKRWRDKRRSWFEAHLLDVVKV